MAGRVPKSTGQFCHRRQDNFDRLCAAAAAAAAAVRHGPQPQVEKGYRNIAAKTKKMLEAVKHVRFK